MDYDTYSDLYDGYEYEDGEYEGSDYPDIQPQPSPSTPPPPSATPFRFSWLNVTGDVNVTDVNGTDYGNNVTLTADDQLGVLAAQKGKGISPQTTMTMILIPECIVLFLFAVCVIALGLIKWKMLRRNEMAKNNAMNTEDLAFYQQVYKIPGKSTDSADACSTLLPQEMPPFGYFDSDKPDKYKSLVPALKSDLNIAPGYFEILRIQLRPRRSTLVRPVRSAPNTAYESDWEEPFGRQLHITTSSPAVLVGLWHHYRSEIFRQQDENNDLCPAHAEIQSLISDGRSSPSAYRRESLGFEFERPLQSSASTIPRKITCRFCRERAMRTRTPGTTPGASPMTPRKQSCSHASMHESGLLEESGTLSTRAMLSLGAVRIEHYHDSEAELQEETQEPSSDQDIEAATPSGEIDQDIEAATPSGEIDQDIEAATPSGEIDQDIEAATPSGEIDASRGRRQSIKPDLEAFKAMILSDEGLDGCNSAGTMASAISSSFFTSGKDGGLPSAEPSSQSIKSLQERLSSNQMRSRRSIFLSKSDHRGSGTSRIISSGRLDTSVSDGRVSSTQRMSGSAIPEVVSPNQGSTGDNAICSVLSICQSVVSTLAIPSNEDLENEQPPSNTSSAVQWSRLEDSCSRNSVNLAKSCSSAKSASLARSGSSAKSGSLAKSCSSAKSASLAKSSSSAKSGQGSSVSMAKSSSGKLKWCFRKSRSSIASDTAPEEEQPEDDGLRSPSELLAPPELPDDDQPQQAGAEAEGHMLLASYYGTDTEASTDSEDELSWLQP